MGAGWVSQQLSRGGRSEKLVLAQGFHPFLSGARNSAIRSAGTGVGLERPWTMLAYEQDGLLNASRLATALTISTETVTRYIDLLVDLLLEMPGTGLWAIEIKREDSLQSWKKASRSPAMICGRIDVLSCMEVATDILSRRMLK
jgi:hypothetical protein